MALKLSFSPAAVPYGPLALAQLRGVALDTEELATGARDAPPRLATPTGEVAGAAAVFSALLALGSGSEAAAADSDAARDWVAHSATLVSGNGFEPALAKLGAALGAGGPFLCGQAVSAGDVAVWGALASARQWDALRKQPAHAAAATWHALVGALPACAATVEKHLPAAARAARDKAAKAEAAAAAAAAAGTAEAAGGSFEIGLVGAEEGNVVTRFPPEPSGFLHIGHAKAALLNEYFARRYKGRLLLRFDDTNPAKEKEDYVQNIMADVAALGIVPDAVTYTSDHFDALLVLAERLITEGKCYVDDTPVEQMRQWRMDGVPSPAREATVEANLALWREMVAGTPAGVKCCLRFKIDMSDPNKTLRDPVAYRCNTATPHHRTGTRYVCYPTYDCACPYVDAVEGVTHALRTSEYRDREAQYIWIQAAMGLRQVHIWDYSRLNFEYTTLSKRKLGWFVEAGKVGGWDDPRFPTVQGVMRRGLTVAALREFILSQGASKNLNTMTWEKLWTMNKRVIDPVCPRHTAVEAERVRFHLAGAEEGARAVPRHKKCAAAGEKTLHTAGAVWLDRADAELLQVGEEVTLMDWGNAIVRGVSGSGAGLELRGELHLAGDFKKTKLKLTWLAHLPDSPAAALTPLELRTFDHLITKRKVEEEDNIADLFNDASLSVRPAVGDANMRTLQKGEVLQLERKGYWIVDSPYDAAINAPVVLLSIPDGHETNSAVATAAAEKAAAEAAAAAAAAAAAPAGEAPLSKKAQKAAAEAAKKASAAAAAADPAVEAAAAAVRALKTAGAAADDAALVAALAALQLAKAAAAAKSG